MNAPQHPTGFVIRGVSNAHYQASPGLSTSGMKMLMKSPATYHYWSQRQRPHKDVYDFGTIVHTICLGHGDPYVELPFDSYRSRAAQDARDEARAAGLIPCLPGTLTQAKECAHAVLSHPSAGPLFLDVLGDDELSMWWDDPDTGVRLKARADRAAAWQSQLVDLKTTNDASPRGFARDAFKYGYHIQRAVYGEVFARTHGLDHDAVRFLFVAVEKTPPYLVCVHELGEDEVRMGREAMQHAIRLYAECSETGVWTGYPDTVQPLTFPTWAHMQHEEDLGIDYEIEV